MFISNLKALRVSKDLNMKQLADKLNIPADNYRKYERGDRTPDRDTLILLANFYKVSLDYLLKRYE